MKMLRFVFFNILLFGALAPNFANTPLYRVFEHQIINNNNYKNKYTDVTLYVQYQAPSGKHVDFYGFFDGDGKGNTDGNVWKIRFMPDEIGTWNYIYEWSDKTIAGKGTFECVAEGAGKGVIQPYEKNKHWFAYNGVNPVWLKSYYETGHGSIGQNFEWVTENVYSTLTKSGYNHLQVNWLLSLCCASQYYKDGPAPTTTDLTLYQEGDLFGTMSLDIWKRMEQHLGWLNDRDVGVHMFLGVDGSRNNGPDWKKLSHEEKDWFVRYMVSRLAPFANVAGWNFVWEVPGDREDQELGFARLIQKYDIFNHLSTYEDEMPRENEYNRKEYSFAAVENHEIATDNKDSERHLWKEPWTHHMACLLGYKGKPVFMSEGNALWRRYWQKRTKATHDDLRRSAWACATAGASFTWCGHAGEEALFAHGPEGLPFTDDNPYFTSEKHLQILSDVMNKQVAFHSMKPHDQLLSDHPAMDVYALAEPGQQYLVFTPYGRSFSLSIEKGEYANLTWIDTQTGKNTQINPIDVKDDLASISFTPPNQVTDWVLIIRK